MNMTTKLLAAAAVWLCAANAQDPSKPVLRAGVSVQMPIAEHAVAMRAADELDATVIAITADGKLFAGTSPIQPAALSSLRAATIYVKADARAPFQKVLTVLDALKGKTVGLLAATATPAEVGKMATPHGIVLIIPK